MRRVAVTRRAGSSALRRVGGAAWAWVVAGATLLAAVPAQGQQIGNWQVVPRYSTVLPVGGPTRDITSDFSWRGATVDVVRFFSQELRVGVSAGWHVLDSESSGTEVFPNGAITGNLRRYVNAVPLTAVAFYEFGGRWGPKPFVGAGTGVMWVENRAEAGAFDVENDNWHWALTAEAGIGLPRPGGSVWDLSARYHWAVENDGVERQYITFSLGYRIGG